MYTGPQHLHVLGGVEHLRHHYGQDAVTLKIVSAGYGVIDEHRVIAPYDLTFNTMSRRQAREWARHLAIASDFRQTLFTPLRRHQTSWAASSLHSPRPRSQRLPDDRSRSARP